jgi:hypothetical protein
LAKFGRPYIKNKIKIEKLTRSERVTQVVECLPSMHEALGPIPNTTHKKRKEREIWCVYTTE